MPPPPDNRQYTVIVVSSHSRAVRKFHMPRRWIRRGLMGGMVFGFIALVTLLHYFTLLTSSAENRVLKDENAQLRSQILLVRENAAQVQSTLDRVERFEAKLRTEVTTPEDPERHLAIGPVDPPPANEDAAGVAPAAHENLAALPGRIQSLQPKRSARRQASENCTSTSTIRTRSSPRPRPSGPRRAG